MFDKEILFLAVVLFLGIIIAAVFNSTGQENAPVWRRILHGIYFGVIISIATSQIIVQRNINYMMPLLKDHSVYEGAYEFVHAMDDIAARPIFLDGMRQIDRDLYDVAKGQLSIVRDDVFTVWGSLFKLASNHVRATNIVSEEDWRNFDKQQIGTEAQKEAIERGVWVDRIMIYNSNNPSHREGLLALACAQKKELGDSYRPFGVELSALDNPVYSQWLDRLRTNDIVLFDDDNLLLTTTYELTGEIRNSRLVVDKALIKDANNFFNRLLNDATPITCGKEPDL